MSQPHVLHLVEYLYLGGIERLLEQLASQTREGAKLSFFSYETSELQGIGLKMREQGHAVHLYKKSQGRDWKLVKKLSELIKKEKIDVIHTHDFGPMEYAVLLKMFNPKLKLIHTQHTLHHFINNKKYCLAFQVASPFYDKIIAVSEHVKRTLLESCPYMYKKNFIVIPNGVDTSHFEYQPQPAETSEKKLRLVNIARISPEKNLDFLLQTCLYLKKAGVDFEFHHAGTTSDTLVIEKIHQFIFDHQLENEVTLHGYTDQAKEILALGDYFISASKTEGHPVAVLEAMAAGKICLCSDIPPHREIGEEAIVFFDINEPHSLFEALTDLSLVETENQARKQLSRNIICEKFSLNSMVENYVANYTTRS